MSKAMLQHLTAELSGLREQGLYKEERVIASRQRDVITVEDGSEVVNFCANDYLGLADHERIKEAAKRGIDERGFGLASVRFICGTQDQHKRLEADLAAFLGTDDTILYPSCFDANGGIFEALLGPEDAVISDALNHASIIDGVRLSKAQRFRYANADLADLEAKLQQAREARFRWIVTDGVFSMDGIVAPLAGICDLADRYDALVMVDDAHATGFMGEHGRGSHEHCGVMGRVDVINSTLGKALGGATGGFTSGRKEIVAWLRQRSRPYLFSNSVAPPVVAASLTVLTLLAGSGELRRRVHANAARFREGMTQAGFDLAGADHPIVPVMTYDASLASRMADALLQEGIYVIGFSYPVVPQGQARIRVQMSARHSDEQIDRAVDAFTRVGRSLGLIGA